MAEETAPHRQWRNRLTKYQAAGERMEAIAEKHLQIPFEVRPDWMPPALDWCAFGLTLQVFCARVAQVAEAFGPPDKTNAEHWGGSYDDSAPDLIAKWKRGNGDEQFEIAVRTFSPKGCKIDPRTRYVKGEETTIHAECKAVLEGLLELPEAVTP